jgi:NAD-dependent dihydropyrimidine dehydrogenase PreA subunit
MKIKQSECIGCGQCLDNCQYGAIKTTSTSGYAKFNIDESKCINCGVCKINCPGECIE